MQNCNYLGRDTAGNYFQGSLDDFRVYNKTLSSGEVTTLYNTPPPSPVTPPNDTTAPTPNAETWLVNPTAISDSAITMSGTVGTDASNYVAYYFTNTAGAGHSSGWISQRTSTLTSGSAPPLSILTPSRCRTSMVTPPRLRRLWRPLLRPRIRHGELRLRPRGHQRHGRHDDRHQGCQRQWTDGIQVHQE